MWVTYSVSLAFKRGVKNKIYFDWQRYWIPHKKKTVDFTDFIDFILYSINYPHFSKSNQEFTYYYLVFFGTRRKKEKQKEKRKNYNLKNSILLASAYRGRSRSGVGESNRNQARSMDDPIFARISTHTFPSWSVWVKVKCHGLLIRSWMLAMIVAYTCHWLSGEFTS